MGYKKSLDTEIDILLEFGQIAGIASDKSLNKKITWNVTKRGKISGTDALHIHPILFVNDNLSRIADSYLRNLNGIRSTAKSSPTSEMILSLLPSSKVYEISCDDDGKTHLSIELLNADLVGKSQNASQIFLSDPSVG